MMNLNRNSKKKVYTRALTGVEQTCLACEDLMGGKTDVRGVLKDMPLASFLPNLIDPAEL